MDQNKQLVIKNQRQEIYDLVQTVKKLQRNLKSLQSDYDILDCQYSQWNINQMDRIWERRKEALEHYKKLYEENHRQEVTEWVNESKFTVGEDVID